MQSIGTYTTLSTRFGPLTAGVLFCVFMMFPSTCGAEDNSAYRYILYLVDSSYSMGVTIPGTEKSQPEITRDLVTSSIENYVSVGNKNSRLQFGLATFSGPGSFTVRVPFTPFADRITEALPDLEYWGTTDLDSGISAADAYIRKNTSAGVKLVLISDGVNTIDGLYSLPEVDMDAHIELLPLPLPYNRPAERRWTEWMFTQGAQGPETGGIETGGPKTGNREAGGLQTADPKTADPKTADPKTADPMNGKASIDEAGSIKYFSSSLVYIKTRGKPSAFLSGSAFMRAGAAFSSLTFFLCLFLVCAGSGVYWSIRRKALPAAPVYHRVYRIHCRKKNLGSTIHEKKEVLPDKKGFLRFQSGGTRFKLAFAEGNMELFSSRTVLIDGVAAKHRKIHEGSRIRLQGFSLILDEVEKIDIPEEGPPDILSGMVLLPSAISLCLFLAALGVLSFTRTDHQFMPRKVESTLVFRPYDWQADFISGAEQDMEIIREEPVTLVPGKTETGWDFHELPGPGEIDLLCFHSHPDDESIDFGGLLAKAAMEGKSTAVVLFTDGESGLSRGPLSARVKDAETPLKTRRVREASDAMRLLGVDYYICLGLQNHPYSSQVQVMPIEGVYKDWGGYETVKSAVMELLTKMEPAMVVSPDGPSPAFEHFEHDAVGYVVAEALKEIQHEGGYYPDAFLTSVDPLQKAFFPEAMGIDVLEPGITGGPSPRAVQNLALQAHVSQIDARIIALEYTSLFQYEYYIDGAD